MDLGRSDHANRSPAHGGPEMGIWRQANRALYRLHYRLRALRPLAASRQVRRATRRTPRPAAAHRGGPRPSLVLSWGRIGDTVLQSGLWRNLRRWLGGPLVMLGREETQPLVERHVDRFVPFDARAWVGDAAHRRALLDRLAGEYECIVGDLHVFHGGVLHLGGLVDALPARHKLLYEGWAGRDRLAPLRPWPRTATVVPSLGKRGADIPSRHVFHDLVHYAGEILRRVGGGQHLDEDDLRPAVDLATAPPLAAERFGLRAGAYVACQPQSNNRKKDFPAARWREVFAALPGETFALLGAAGGAGRDAELAADNVVDLRGRTDLAACAGLIAQARAFVGPDSGLTHIAACLGQRTVCVAHASNLGYFFPYPSRLGFDRLEVVYQPAFAACSGCLSACSEEPLVSTHRRGALCLRTLPAAAVVEALSSALRAPCAALAAVR